MIDDIEFKPYWHDDVVIALVKQLQTTRVATEDDALEFCIRKLGLSRDEAQCVFNRYFKEI